MEKFFIVDGQHVMDWSEDAGSVFGPWLGYHAKRLSFCNLRHAEIFCEKIKFPQKTEHIHDGVEHNPDIFAVDVPSNWSGEEIARWLEIAVTNGEIEPVRP